VRVLQQWPRDDAGWHEDRSMPVTALVGTDWPVRDGLVLPDVVGKAQRRGIPPRSDVGAFVDGLEGLMRLGKLVQHLIGQLAQRI